MQVRCRTRRSWKPDVNDDVGTCSDPALGKRSNLAATSADVLLVEGVRGKEVSVKVGKSFGCVHWRVRRDLVMDQEDKYTRLTPDDVKRVLEWKHLKPQELANLLCVRVARVSDWKQGRRKVPSTAVVAMTALGLL